MSGKPIDEGVLDRALCAWFNDATGAGLDGGPEHREWRTRMAAAQQQGQAVAWRCAKCGTHEVEVDLVCHNSACDAYANSQTVHEGWRAQPMQQGGGEVVATIQRPGWPRKDSAVFFTMEHAAYDLPPGTPLYTAPPSAPVGVEGLPPDGAYLIVYDDADQQPEAFALSGARDAALARFEQVSGNWNAHLYAKIKSNTRDCEAPDALAQQPAAVDEARDLIGALQVAELALRERGLQASGEYRQIEATLAKYADQHQEPTT